jgi:hypothetical protein
MKKGQDEWITLFLDKLDLEMLNKTFSTSELDGDGEYTLRFTVTDTRGKMHFVERDFIVYDPDEPVFIGQVEGPEDTSDLKVDTMTISWEAEDPDTDEVLSYIIEVSPVEEENWTLVAEDVTETSYQLDLTQLEQGRYKLRITAVDDSSQALTSSIEYGPFYYNAPEAPDVAWIYPEPGFSGIIADDLGVANDTGFFNIDLIWSGSDPDGDNITYSLYWKPEIDPSWRLLYEGADNLFTWNVTTFTDGNYMLRLMAKDASEKEMSTELIMGPFSIDIPWDPPVADDDDDTGDDDTGSDSELNIGLIIGISVGSVALVVILVIVILVVLNKTTGKKPDETPVIPTERDVDLSIPDFDRQYPQQAITSGQMVSQGPYAGVQQQVEPAPQQEQIMPPEGAAPAPQVPGQVSWEGGAQQEAPVTMQPPVPTMEQQIPPEQVTQQAPPEPIPEPAPPAAEVQMPPAPIGPPPAMPEVPQGPPPLPPEPEQ